MTEAVFIGGSRKVSLLSDEVKERLNNIVRKGYRVLVGDANGVDKAVQKHFKSINYQNVTVFCSGDRPRNNLGNWQIYNVIPPKSVKGFQFYAVKDREMAQKANIGLMIWDSKSSGTVLNVLRLVRAEKKAVLFNTSDKSTRNITSSEDWDDFLKQCPLSLRDDLRERATSEEWDLTQAQRPGEESLKQQDLNTTTSVAATKVRKRKKANPEQGISSKGSKEEAYPKPLKVNKLALINDALAAHDSERLVKVLRTLALGSGTEKTAPQTALLNEASTAEYDLNVVNLFQLINSLGLDLVAKTKRVKRTNKSNDSQMPLTEGLFATL